MAASFDYQCSAYIARDNWPFYALVMAAMRKADGINLAKLREMFPDVRDELTANEGVAKGGA